MLPRIPGFVLPSGRARRARPGPPLPAVRAATASGSRPEAAGSRGREAARARLTSPARGRSDACPGAVDPALVHGAGDGQAGTPSHQQSQHPCALSARSVSPAAVANAPLPGAAGRCNHGGARVVIPVSGRCPQSGKNHTNEHHLCRSAPVAGSLRRRGLDHGPSVISQVIGASDSSNTSEPGRIAAEWCRTRAMVRRNSRPVNRAGTGGGEMPTGNQVLPGNPVPEGHRRAARPARARQAATAGRAGDAARLVPAPGVQGWLTEAGGRTQPGPRRVARNATSPRRASRKSCPPTRE